jgi:aminoglycoside/choline kinase family phosphotransferase
VSALLLAAQVSAPKVFESDLDQGFLLLSDLGHTTYLEAFSNASAGKTKRLMTDAVAALHRIQLKVPASTLPAYDETLLMREMQLFIDWYLERHCALSLSDTERHMLDRLFRLLAASSLSQPQVAVHRDYHSRNLMVLESDVEYGNPGVLDFQDAVQGALSYDLVSLLRDAYISWPEEEVLDVSVRFWEGARHGGIELSNDFADFWQSFEFMGLQRHLKVLGIFARLSHRDGKHGYLNDMPVVSAYVRAVAARYRAAAPLLRLLDRAEKQQPSVGLTF